MRQDVCKCDTEPPQVTIVHCDKVDGKRTIRHAYYVLSRYSLAANVIAGLQSFHEHLLLKKNSKFNT